MGGIGAATVSPLATTVRACAERGFFPNCLNEGRRRRMGWLAWLILVSDGVPFWRAWRANQRTSLLHAVHWGMLAWAAWTAALLIPLLWPASPAVLPRYLAAVLTGCAVVAVLGARRPGVGAWNFVVAGLLAVLLLPLAEGMGRLRLDWPALVLLVGTVLVGLLNYLPTRLAPAALLIAAGWAVEVLDLGTAEGEPAAFGQSLAIGRLLLALGPWLGLALLTWAPQPPGEFDRLWLDFRDRFGLVWGQRLREQFNRAAANASRPVVLRWRGLRRLPGAPPLDPAVGEEIVAALRALLKRFGPPE
jgi:hypothetical protein